MRAASQEQRQGAEIGRGVGQLTRIEIGQFGETLLDVGEQSWRVAFALAHEPLVARVDLARQSRFT